MKAFIDKFLAKVLVINQTAFSNKPHIGADANWVCGGENC